MVRALDVRFANSHSGPGDLDKMERFLSYSTLVETFSDKFPHARRLPMARPFGSFVELSPEIRDLLEKVERARSTPQALGFRCRIILRAAQHDDPSDLQIANELDCNRQTVAQWRERFVVHGFAGLQDLPRSGRPRSFSPLATG